MGKTRLVLEATRADDLAPLVVFVPDGETFQHTPFFNAMLRTDNDFFVILVIDECQPKDRASIWNLLKPRSQRLRLVTLDHGPDDCSDDSTRVVHVQPLSKETLAAIIADYGLSRFDADRWAGFCEGSPRVAHVVGQNLRQNSDDVFREPATVNVWDRFVVGRDDACSERVEFRHIVLRHLALFERFGFESPVDSEAQWIASLASAVDPRLTWPKFQSVVTELRQRRIVQGRTTLYLVPRLLHVYLYRDFWQHHGRGFDVLARFHEMPGGLQHWFVAMLKYGHTSPVAEQAVVRLLGSEGLLPGDGFCGLETHGRFLMNLAESNPRETLTCLERTIGTWDLPRRREFVTGRQHIVWALEYIAVWSDLFPRRPDCCSDWPRRKMRPTRTTPRELFRGFSP